MLMLPILVAAIVPVRVTAAPRIDGRLDDPAWSTVPANDSFTQSFPRDGAAPSDPTRVQVAYDDDSLYIAIDCVQSTRRLARLTRRDRDVNDDRISLDIDTAHDRRSAFHFRISAAGVHADGLRYQDTELNTAWDEIWQGEVATTANGWSAELAIPLRILRLHADVSTWGFQIRRWTGATGELDTWAYAPRDAGGEVSRYGDLGPFDGLSPRQSLALVPFGLMREVRSNRSVQSQFSDGLSASAGLDATWRPRSNVLVSAAVLPDFGQVEADQVVINLTTTEIEYPEKRPFFLQGMDVFQTPIQLLYTRRIGRATPPPMFPSSVKLQEPFGPSPVLGAAKLVASTGGVELGALSAITGGVDVNASVESPESPPQSMEVPVAFGASHHVLRARTSNLGPTIGLLATAQLQRDDPAGYPRVMERALCASGIDVAPGERCGHDAYTGGIDAAWRSSTGTWAASGQLVGSLIEGGPPRALADGNVVKSGDSGVGGELRIAKEGGTFRGELLASVYSPRLVIDDLGFLERSNQYLGQLNLEAYSAQPRGPLLDMRSRIEIFLRRAFDDREDLPSGYQWNVSVTGKGLWEAFMELHYRPHYFDDRELGTGRALERAGRFGLELLFRSDPHRAISGTVAATLRTLEDASEVYLFGSLAMRPRDDLEIDIESDDTIVRGEPRFITFAPNALSELVPRFARLDATSFGVTARATWTLHRELTLQAYVQALLATLHHRDAFVADAGMAKISLGELQPTATFEPTEYNTRTGALNATVVGRWEYAPGSTVYLVYSHTQVPSKDGTTTFDVGALPRGPSQNVVLLKLSWAWLR